MFAAGEEQRDFTALARGYNACCENTGTSREVFVLNDPVVFQKLQDLHRRIVVVKHLAIGSLTDQFIEDRLNPLGGIQDHFPLSRCRQRDSQIGLQSLHPVERKPVAVLEYGHHRAGCGIVLFLAHGFGGFGSKDFTTGVTAELLPIVDVGMNGSLAHDPD